MNFFNFYISNNVLFIFLFKYLIIILYFLMFYYSMITKFFTIKSFTEKHTMLHHNYRIPGFLEAFDSISENDKCVLSWYYMYNNEPEPSFLYFINFFTLLIEETNQNSKLFFEKHLNSFNNEIFFSTTLEILHYKICNYDTHFKNAEFYIKQIDNSWIQIHGHDLKILKFHYKLHFSPYWNSINSNLYDHRLWYHFLNLYDNWINLKTSCWHFQYNFTTNFRVEYIKIIDYEEELSLMTSKESQMRIQDIKLESKYLKFKHKINPWTNILFTTNSTIFAMLGAIFIEIGIEWYQNK